MGACNSQSKNAGAGARSKPKQRKHDNIVQESAETKRLRMLEAAEKRLQKPKVGKPKNKYKEGCDEYGLPIESKSAAKRPPSAMEQENAEAYGATLYSTKDK